MTTYRPCAECARPMRTSRQRPAKDHPGTVAYGAHGKCATCRDKELHAPDDYNVQRAAMMLGLLAIERRRRGVVA